MRFRKKNVLIFAGILMTVCWSWSFFIYQESKGSSSGEVKQAALKVLDKYNKIEKPMSISTQTNATGYGKDLHTTVNVNEKRERKLIPQAVTSSLSRYINVYNFSKTKISDRSSCVITRTATVFTICTYIEKEDIFISGALQLIGQWEDDITTHLHDFLKQDRAITFIDIGANIGYFSLLAAAVGQPVVAIEPWKQNVEKLANSIHENKFEKEITVLNNAVSNDRRIVRIDVSIRNNKGAARVIAESEKVSPKETITVKSIVLNDIAEFIHTANVVIKLDVEGHECRVLETSEDVFEKFNVLLIIMEWRGMQKLKHTRGVACPDRNIQEMVKTLTERGFVPYAFTTDQQLNPKLNEEWTNNDIYWAPSVLQ